MDSDDSYILSKLKNKELIYIVEDSKLDQNFNGALYFVQMDADAGKSKYGIASIKYDLKSINSETNVEDWKTSELLHGRIIQGSTTHELDDQIVVNLKVIIETRNVEMIIGLIYDVYCGNSQYVTSLAIWSQSKTQASFKCIVFVCFYETGGASVLLGRVF